MTAIIVVIASLVYLLIGFALVVATNNKKNGDRFSIIAMWPVLMLLSCGYGGFLGLMYLIDKAQIRVHGKDQP